MARQLLDANIEFISLVKRGANGERITIYKSANAEDNPPGNNPVVKESPGVEGMDEMKGFFTLLKNFFVGKSKDLGLPDYKSFSSRITNKQSNIKTAMYSLEDTMYEIFWDSNIENGGELILKNVDDFRKYISDILSSTEVSKEFFKKEESDMNKEELKEMLATDLDPITKSIEDLAEKVEKLEKLEESQEEGLEVEGGVEKEEKLEKDNKEIEKEEKIEKEGKETEELTIDIIKSLLVEALEPISKSIGDISDRVEVVEQARGITKSKEGKEVKKEDDWRDGLLGFIS